MMRLVLLIALLLPSTSWAATYFISPSGSNSNNGTTDSTPWKTFAFAINAARAWCGDTLIVRTGAYGPVHGNGTDVILISGVVCTQGDELTIRAEEQRQAAISDSGAGVAVRILNSAYINIDGLFARSTITNTHTGDRGRPFEIQSSHHIQVKNSEGATPNKYANAHILPILYSSDILVEDFEGYEFHRHCVTGFRSERITVRRVYCNPREGRIPGGWTVVGATPGSADTVFSMYPCKDCIQENTIAEGPMDLNEMNADNEPAPAGSPVVNNVRMQNSQLLGSISIGATYSNVVYLNSRRNTNATNSPTDILIRDVAIIDYNSPSRALRCSDCVNVTIDHVSIYGGDDGVDGIVVDDTATGVAPAAQSVTITNTLVRDMFTYGYRIVNPTLVDWSIDRSTSFANGTNFSPSTPNANITNVSTLTDNNGTCKLWASPTSTLKGTGTNGSDKGATILYRYVDGVLTNTPLWDPTTGEFPHGALDPDGFNSVAGDSLADVHTRLNVNTGGCSFPADYASPTPPSDPATHQSGTGTAGASWSHTIDPGTQGLLVGVALYDVQGNVGTVTGVTGCSSENIPALSGATAVTSLPYRRVYIFGKTNPTAGSCTITVTTTGNVDFTVGTSVEIPLMGSFGTATAAAAPASTPTGTPSLTIATNTGETVIDFLAGKCVPVSGACTTTLTAGADQTIQKDTPHTSGDLRLVTSQQAGLDGGVMSYTMGTINYWAIAAVPVISSSPDPPSTAVLTQTEYVICDGYGEDATVVCRTKNTAASVGPEGLVRLQFEITGTVADTTPFGVALYCDRNSGGYAKAADNFGSNAFRLYGPGGSTFANPIPASSDTITGRLGSPVGAMFLRDSSSSVVVPVLTAGQTYEVGFELQLNASAGDTVLCRVRKDSGTVLDAYSQTATINVRTNAANMGY